MSLFEVSNWGDKMCSDPSNAKPTANTKTNTNTKTKTNTNAVIPAPIQVNRKERKGRRMNA